MKYTYNLSNFSTAVKSPTGNLDVNIEVKGMAVSVEFDASELTTVVDATIKLKEIANEMAVKVIPIVKDGLIEVMKVVSVEIEKHRRLDKELASSK